jgi:alpha-ketoglutarate-dependent dioxygenase FTO
MNPSRKGNGKKRKRSRSREPDRDKPEEHSSSNGVTASTAVASASASASASSSSSSSSLFLTPQCPGFEKHVRDHYKGFVHCSVDDLQPFDFHQQARAALERLRDANYYQYDIVMAGGKHSSRTFVKRTLVGNPGITYKYLGLRLFAHSWSGPGVIPLMKCIGEMNQQMIRMTETFQNHQNCQYNLTLINYMEPTIRTKVGFKEEANYGMGKVSVSWHADSSLEIGSSIGVYHCLPTQRSAKWDWRIALRPSPDGKNNSSSSNNNKLKIENVENVPAKPVVVNTKDGDAYFLLGGFNETHQHCVLAGSQSNRISSTHRVAVTHEDTYDYILKRVKIARKRFRLQMEASSAAAGSNYCSLDAKVIRYCQRVLTEVEMEWIAQYWLQGAQHDKMHTWWQRPMKTLEAYWRALEAATWKLYYHLCCSSSHEHNKNVDVDVIKVLINEFKTRQSSRQQWDERRADKIYKRRITEEYRPVARPIFDEGEADTNHENNEGNKEKGNGRHPNKDEEKRLPKDLTSAIHNLQLLLGENPGGASTKPKKHFEKNFEKHFAGRSKPGQPDSTTAGATAISTSTNGTDKIKQVDYSRGSVDDDRPIEKHESNSKKKRKSKKKKKK